MTRTARRRCRATALALGLAVLTLPTVAAALDTTIRVEGTDDTVLPESAIAIEGPGTLSTLYDTAGATADVDNGSAFWQLYRATSAAGLEFGFTAYSFGNMITTVGPHAGTMSAGWQFKVNHVSPQVGADATPLDENDSVVWYFGGYAGGRSLDATASAPTVERGNSFQVAVVSYDEEGRPSPAAGAAVTYGQATATADAQGNAHFIAHGEGTHWVRASRAGDVRSASRPVCSWDADPTICNLPPTSPPPVAPPTPTPAPAPSASADTVPPGSAILFPAPGARVGNVSALRGAAGPDRSDVARVEVSVGRLVGTQCRFRTAEGTLTEARSCEQPLWLSAVSSGGNWVLPLGGRLPEGRWRVRSRATDGAGNTETTALPGLNSTSFTVPGRTVAATSRLTSPRPGARLAQVRILRGSAGPAAADVTLVEVAVAQRVAGQCRFRTARGALTGARPCSRPIFVAARSTGGRWSLDLGRGLAAGTWTVWTRATGAESGRGRTTSARVIVAGRTAR